MRPILTFTVAHDFPESLSRLHELSTNLYWTWNPTIREFLRPIDPDEWHTSNHHPLKVLQATSAERLQELSEDRDFMKRYHESVEALDSYLDEEDRATAAA